MLTYISESEAFQKSILGCLELANINILYSLSESFLKIKRNTIGKQAYLVEEWSPETEVQ